MAHRRTNREITAVTTDTADALRTPGRGAISTLRIMAFGCALASAWFGGTFLLASEATEPPLGLAIDGRTVLGLLVSICLLTPLTGAVVDLCPRRGLVVAVFFAAAATLAISTWLPVARQGVGAWLGLAAAGAWMALAWPLASSILPALVRRPRLTRANGLLLTSCVLAGAVAWVIHPGIASANTGSRAAAWAFLAAAAIFCGLPRLKSSAPLVRRSRPRLRIARGIRYAASRRPVRELLIVAALVWFCAAILCVLTAHALASGHGDGGEAFTRVLRCVGYGVLGGALLMTAFDDAARNDTVISWGFLAIGVGALVAALGAATTWPYVPQANLVSAGLTLATSAAAATIISYNALLQRIVADRHRGRVFGLRTAGAAGAVLAVVGVAALLDLAGATPRLGTVLFGTAILAATVSVLTMRVRVRRSVHGAQVLFLENLNSFLMRFLYRFRRIGPSTVPRTGSAIVVANHRCSLDPWFLSAGAPYRLISFLIAAEYAGWPIVRYYVRRVECISVRRGSRETRATKQAIRHLRAGRVLGVFIEGGILPPGEPRHPKDGAAVLALKTGATVIPAHISGIRYRDGLIAGVLSRHRARVRFGRPVDLSEFSGAGHNRDMVHAATRKIYAAIQALAPREPLVKDDETYDPARVASLEHSA